ncbi:MAG: histidinol dehydrogenase [Desulfovibrionaceae bacterium]|nr:histidinol dehydrogenase [Desulfovibrionaceae bacterium]
MICRTITVNSLREWQEASLWLKARAKSSGDVETDVKEILKQVETKGDEALINYTSKFDCPNFTPPLRIPELEIQRAAALVSAKERDQIYAAADNIRAFHNAQVEKSWFMTRPDGTILGQRVQPVDAAGLYVPGGQGGNTPLISTLIMTAIPAQTAGVKRICICTPPREDGTVNPYILAAAHLLNLNEIYRVGGAWSIGALAYGTKSIPKVDVIAGPGNIYVTSAKRLVQGQVGIDMIAGPSEVLILCDGSAYVDWLAADLLSQAEHDKLASAICITTEKRIFEELPSELEKQCAKLPRHEIAKSALENFGAIVLAKNTALALEIANEIAPEHLELCMRDAWSLMPQIRHAGAIFLGLNSPEPLGDYYAGPNHVLPTMGTAKFSSALSVETFCKKTSIIAASSYFLQSSIKDVTTLARLEGLEAHARSLEIRKR